MGNDVANRLHEEYVAADLEWWSDRLLIEALSTAFTPEFAILLEDHIRRVTDLKIQDARYGARYDVQITCRLLGGDTGASVLLHLGQQVLLNIIEDQRHASRPLTEEELARIAAVRARRGAYLRWEADAARFRPGSRAAYFIASVTASRQLQFATRCYARQWRQLPRPAAAPVPALQA